MHGYSLSLTLNFHHGFTSIPSSFGGTGFVQIMKNLESHEIEEVHLPDVECHVDFNCTRNSWKINVCLVDTLFQMSKQGQFTIETSNQFGSTALGQKIPKTKRFENF